MSVDINQKYNQGTASIAAVIPAYNESSTIRDVVERTIPHAGLVVVVDDGSTDQTADIVSELAVRLIRHPTNTGKGESIIDGVNFALGQGATWVVTLDGDGQHKPEDIPRLLAVARSQPGNIIIGSRMAHKGNFPVSRYRANRFANFWISWAAGYAIEDSQSGFRVYPGTLMQEKRIRDMNARGFVFESEILIEASRCGYQSVPVEVDAIYSTGVRMSHFRPVRDIALIVRMVAWKLISRGLYLQGLYRALSPPQT
ncbi:MAG: glycosyltransferase family 2 protein [Gammaproteobacteria bacterium]|nr:MAG: glycosyltransferase family 2 protein [Gammaproteobacteria bacterium]